MINSYNITELDALISQNYFWNKTLQVSDSSSAPSSGVFHCPHSNSLCHMGLLSVNPYDIYCCCVYSEKLLKMGQRTCLKHVEFYSKNNFEKFVHLVGFIIRIPRCITLPSILLLPPQTLKLRSVRRFLLRLK